jgi:Na+/H+-dicarboxylate symporter
VRGLMDSEEPNEKLMSKMQSAKKTKDSGPLQPLVDMVPSNIFFALNNNGLMLQVIFFAIFFGVTLISIPREMAQPVIGVIDGMNEVFLKMVDFVMQAAPFFVFALLAGVISKMAGDDPNAVIEIFKGLGWYSLVVVAGLGFMIFVFYPLLVQFSIKGMTYRRFFKAISPAQFLAFSTSSSAATLPVTMDCVRDNLGVSKETTSFVLPIGATVNMDGTSMYQAIAVVFLAQFHAVDLSITQQLMIVLTATLASIGSAAVPSAGLIMLIIVLESVGLNPAWVAIIFPVDRILDMCRTTVNVTGDCSVATIVADSEGQLDRTNWSNLD